MKILYSHPSCPFSRKIRIMLKEKNVEFNLQEINFWERTNELLRLNPSGELPILNDNGIVICGVIPITEYINEVLNNEVDLLGKNAQTRAEVRRIAVWFNEKFYREVTKFILNEKIIKYYKRITDTNSHAIRNAKTNIIYHLDYINFLLSKNDWLGSENISIADFAAASQLSVLDYFADVPWEYNFNVREWYAIIKSRPSFQEILQDRIQGFIPPKHYNDLDF